MVAEFCLAHFADDGGALIEEFDDLIVDFVDAVAGGGEGFVEGFVGILRSESNGKESEEKNSHMGECSRRDGG